MDIKELEKKLNYEFNDISLLKEALTHSSKTNENKELPSNERLEFLGDAVLSIVIGDLLYRKLKTESEGVLTKLRALIVCADSLYIIAREIELGKYMELGKGEIASGGRKKKNILADAFEAVIGAIYIDAGFHKVFDISVKLLNPIIEKALSGTLTYDYKTMLQEYSFANNLGKVNYVLVKTEGPEHNQIFTSKVFITEDEYGIGKGGNKKESEQNAAHDYLIKIKKI